MSPTVHDRSANVSWTKYTAFGLRIASELNLPELLLAAPEEAVEDVVIRQVDLTAWSGQLEQANFVMLDERFMFQIPGTAIYAVREGKEIEVSIFSGADPDTVRLFVLGTCMGALLMQRRILPIHGSAVVIGGGPTHLWVNRVRGNRHWLLLLDRQVIRWLVMT